MELPKTKEDRLKLKKAMTEMGLSALDVDDPFFDIQVLSLNQMGVNPIELQGIDLEGMSISEQFELLEQTVKTNNGDEFEEILFEIEKNLSKSEADKKDLVARVEKLTELYPNFDWGYHIMRSGYSCDWILTSLYEDQ